jgi:hypothetical protein
LTPLPEKLPVRTHKGFYVGLPVNEFGSGALEHRFLDLEAKLRTTVVPTTRPKMLPDAKSENQWTVMETLRPM